MAARRAGCFALLGLTVVGPVGPAETVTAPVKGTYAVGILAQGNGIAQLLVGSNVSCVWRGDHVIVRLRLHNTSVEHVTATIQPTYVIENGGAQGDGFTSAQDFGLDAGETRNLKIDAGKPKGVLARSEICECAPYLFAVKSG